MKGAAAIMGLVAVAAAGGVWQWQRAGSPVSSSETSETTTLAPDAERSTVMDVGAPPTLATLPPQPMILRIVTYRTHAVLSGVDPAGHHVTLHDIYAPANIDVTTDIQPDRAYPFPSGYITEAELSTLATEPQSGGHAWKVTAFMLRRGTQAGDYGMIFPNESRQRLAVFTDEIGDPNRVLRTLAHELGHTLNLFHNDGDATFKCCAYAYTPKDGTSLMNQDACLDALTWNYDLGLNALDHLRNHPLASVNPDGSAPFGDCTSQHQRTC
jgi:hypothetical protein